MEDVRENEILLAAIAEFAENGYSRANTNRICSAAGVSKGLIFHYFNSKKILYISAVKKCVDDTLAFFSDKYVDEHDTEFTTALLRYYRLRVDFFNEHPFYYKILMKAMNEAPIEAKAEIDLVVVDVIKLGEDILRRHFKKIILKNGVRQESALIILTTVLSLLESKHVDILLEGGSIAESKYYDIEEETREVINLAIYGMSDKS